MLYRIYIDEVGNHDLKSADKPNERFLSLTGVIIESSYIRDTVAPEMNELKRGVFNQDPDEPVILHRKDIVKKRGPFKVLLDGTIEKVVTVLIDKLAHREQYKVWKAQPYHYCLHILLERFLMFLQDNDGRGDVLVESRGGPADMKLKDSYARLYRSGTDYISSYDFQKRFTSKELKVKPKSANIPGLQIADLVAYPSRREILHEKGFLADEAPNFNDEIAEILLSAKYLRNTKTTEIWRYGKKWLP